MKAAVCREFNKPLQIENLEIASPEEGEVRVKLDACAICHSDITYMDGGWGGSLPMVLGHEAAGVVVEIGAGVRHIQVGDHVLVTLIRSCGHCADCENGEPYICSTPFPIDEKSRLTSATGEKIGQGLRTGAFAEEVVVDQSQLVILPKNFPMDTASLLSCGVITGLGAVVNTAKVDCGASVVVIGCGGVGLNSIQGAALVNAAPIIAIDLVEEKLKPARSFGATHTVNPLVNDAVEYIRGLTIGRGADYVFVAAGSPRAFEQGLDLLAPSGTLVIVGMPPTGQKIAVEAGNIAGSGQRILGSKMGSTRLRVDIPKLVALYEAGRLKLDELITGRYPLEKINEAIDEVRADKALRNVIIFE
ncbi:Zn-dependent alcohol dehydrogenase [Sneathiella litorea]|uniref:Alcohol dehydrogenase catalytic domain-containing protein n=1 Tax=Sneathiella litorea TaxID=2606216 RepID=A0A6L8WDU3_9PROT|nr:Zn-dependent alcohol dehydrogenase [Sneathiella litorea]MZR32513.1 alcohol dehydrogenase catalytic domain-containing protein [Sneathiella litorea]